MIWPASLVVGLWTLLVILLVALDVLAALSPKALVLTRVSPSAVRLTQEASSQVGVRNPSRRVARVDVRDSWPPTAGATGDRHRLVIPPGEAATCVTCLTPTRRGVRTAGPVTVRSRGPLGLAYRQRSFEVPSSLRVLPAFRSRVHLPARLARLRDLDGTAIIQQRGQGTEFDSLRVYQDGDDVRSIDWRATARSSAVMVRTWRMERDRRVVIVLDCSRWAAGRIGDETRLDAAIETALLLGALASAGGDVVHVLAVDRAVRARASASAGLTELARLSSALAGVEPALVEPDWSRVVAEIGRTVRQRALVVLVTSTDPAVVEDGLASVISQLVGRHAVLIATPRDPAETDAGVGVATPTEAYRAGAASRRELWTEATEAALRSLGAHTVAAPAGALAPAVADAYLTLKAGGQL